MKKTACTRCINDSTVRNITFDKEGVCNYCRSYDIQRDKLLDYPALEENFLKRINRERNKHKYDVAMGISGGKDSTYVLYKLVKVYKLNVIAYTLDNGFLSTEARMKIDSLVKELGVEHEYVVCDEELLKEMYHYIVSKYLSPCIACSYLGYAVMINYASKVDAAVGMHGRSIPQMLRNFDMYNEDPFKPFILSGLSDVDSVDLNALYESSLMRINQLIDKKLFNKIKEMLLKDALKNGYRDFIAYFLYHPYDKNEVITYIKDKISWVPNGEEEHFDCYIHNAARFIKNLIARRSHLMPELSVMVRNGSITRLEALKLANDDIIKCPDIEMDKMCKYAGLNKMWLLTKAKIYSKRWW